MIKEGKKRNRRGYKIDDKICNGKPTIRGKRITVQTILEFLQAGETKEVILHQYPSLEAEEIWEYCSENNLTIVSKDSDFSEKILFHEPPPRVIHIKFGNVKMKEFHVLISNRWEMICKISTE